MADRICPDCKQLYTRIAGWSRRCLKCSGARTALSIRAMREVSMAIRRGEMARQPCEVCGKTKTVGHHDDYSRPLDVRWLCGSHHQRLHVEQFAAA